MNKLSPTFNVRLLAALAIVMASVGTATADDAVADVEVAFRNAEEHGEQANEQFVRCRRFVEGWLNQADPHTGLIPRNLTAIAISGTPRMRRPTTIRSWC